MNKKYDIGVIGNGFVGSAIVSGFGLHANVRIFDANPSKSLNNFSETINESEFVFVCVPTPMSKSSGGKIDLKILHSVFKRIELENQIHLSSHHPL